MIRKCLVVLTFVLIFNSCATLYTISKAKPGSVKIYSGSRLDLVAIAKDRKCIRKLGLVPPPYPLLDLPFSFVLDTIILPLTFSVSFYDAAFEGERPQVC